ncbi:LuxR C-terminal-related transcriptional regulator [Alkalicoccus chagannorensis]|uniref:LuxR C-terminal-related transcriptional regulator n=1 Tax=Alkalicoccus chagannorensis TaxID=427072 RepID=UPI0004275199|nr:LuxR C-terminal-related transcriptional regulator [Alkalicoccus chagannorensis]
MERIHAGYTVHHGLLEREELRRSFDAVGENSVSIVTAPTGYGKTTMLRQWSEEAVEWKTVWLTLSDRDQDPVSFLRRFFQTLKEAGVNVTESVEDALVMSYQRRHTVPVTPLMEVLQLMKEPVVLLVDEADHLSHPVLVSWLEQLLLERNHQLKLCLISRAALPLKLHRLKLHGGVKHWSRQDFQFSLEETKQFLLQEGAGLSEEDLERVHHFLEGWPAGVKLSSLYFQHEPEATAASFLQDDTTDVSYYLVEEVVMSQSIDVQKFMIYTARLFPKMNAELCDYVLEREDSYYMIRYLREINAFLHRIPEEHGWYRYHQLMKAAVTSRCSVSEETERAFHYRAFEWYESRDMMGEAVEHLLQGQWWDAAEAYMQKVSLLLLKSGEVETLLRWTKAFPLSYQKNSAPVLLIQAWSAALHHMNRRAREILAAIEASFSDDIETMAEVHVIRIYMAFLDNEPRHSLDRFRQAVEEGIEETSYLQESVVLNFGETCLLRSRLGCRGNLFLTYDIFTQLRWMFTSRQMILLGYGSAMLGEIMYEWNQRHLVNYYVHRGIDLGVRHYHLGVLFPTCWLGVRQALAVNNLEEAYGIVDLLEDTMENSEEVSAHWRDLCACIRIRVAEHSGDDTMLETWYEQKVFVQSYVAAKEFEQITGVRVLLHMGRYREAVEWIGKLLAGAYRERRYASVIELEMLLASARVRLNEPAEASLHFRRALKQGMEYGYTRTILDAAPLEPLLRTLSDQDRAYISPSYIQMLRTAAGIQPEQAVAAQAAGRTADVTEEAMAPPTTVSGQLSYREQQVLFHMAKGLTNKQIADVLQVAVGTVKSYSHHIYDKLGVRNRGEAVKIWFLKE